MAWDFLVIGAGFTGAAFARRATDLGKRCLVLEQRPVVAGNCHSAPVDGIEVHTYGPHVLHTSNEQIWQFWLRFTRVTAYHHRAYTMSQGKALSLPISLLTLNQLYGIQTPEEARAYFAAVGRPTSDDTTLEGWCLKHIGPDLYERLIKGYTWKQWERDPAELPASIIRRLPLRTTYDNSYFKATHQGIPTEGYTQMIQNMLDGIDVYCGVDYLQHKREIGSIPVVYTGSPDVLFDYDEGHLEYRSLRTEVFRVEQPDVQGVAHMNYADRSVPFHRQTEYKHYLYGNQPYTILMREYAVEFDGTNERCYPIMTPRNVALAARYRARAKEQGIYCIGRLGHFLYLDQDQATGQGIRLAERLLRG